MVTLTPVMKKFILHWGEMGTRWGINRTVAQIHALLYVSPKPLAAEEIAEALSVARSNVSTSLKELQGWGIVHVVHVMGDRRDHFQTMSDVWEMFRQVMDERKKREIDPTLALLRDCLAETGGSEAHVRQRLRDMEDFFQKMCSWYEQVSKMPTQTLMKFVGLGARVGKLLGLA